MSAGKDTKIFGGLGSISLHDLIQLLGMNGRTATLVLGRQGRKGKIYFKNGNVIHAFTGEIEGQPAFAELLRWEDADFIIEDGIPTLPKVTITESAVGLMLTTLTRIDEDLRDTPAVGTPISPGSVAEAPPPPRPPTPSRGTPRVRRPVTGAVITVPEAPTSSFPWLPVASVAVLVAAAGGTWALLNSSETPIAAAGAPPATAPPTTLATPAPDPPDEAGATAPDQATQPAPVEVATPEPFGVLAAEVGAGVELRVDGQAVAAGARRLTPGRHVVEIVRQDVVGVQQETLVIEPGQTLRRRYTADEYGWLQVVVIPWAEVFVGGQSIGQTPMGKVKAALGEHALALRHPEAQETQTVVIEQGETTLVRVELQGVSG